MAERKTLDQRPGSMPDIRSDGDYVTFHLDIAGVPGDRLVIRCHPDGAVTASIASIVTARRSGDRA